MCERRPRHKLPPRTRGALASLPQVLQVAIGITVILTALLVYAIAGVRSPTTSLLLSDLLQTAIVVWAAYCSYRVAMDSKGQLRRLWLLFTTALFLCENSCTLEVARSDRLTYSKQIDYPASSCARLL